MEYKKIPVGRATDLTGKRFGSLTVLYRTENQGNTTMWVCQCDCGTVKPMNPNYFTRKKDPSCGCQGRLKAKERMLQYNLSQASIYIGQKFGKLTVIEYEGLRKQHSRDKNESWYVCQCECGNIKHCRGNDLMNGRINSCGCIHSYGETLIENILKSNQIKYIKEYSFDDLVNPATNRCLRFDFAVFDKDTLVYLIEFDGRQHFTGPEAKWSNSDSLEEIQFRDNLKNEYCKLHNIPLKRISYNQISKITLENIQSDYFNY